jgi:uncharacterized protein (TIGR02452 family)
MESIPANPKKLKSALKQLKMSKEKRIEIAQQTLAIIEKGFYNNSKGEIVNIAEATKRAIATSSLFRPEDFGRIEAEANGVLKERNYQTGFEVKNESTIDAVIRNYNPSNRTACLNFASAKNPGGGFLNGSQAQEESLARTTAMYPCINQMQEMYSFNKSLKTCMYSDYMIFSEQVPVFRDNADNLLDNPVEVSIITSPAVNAGVVKQREPSRVTEIESVMQNRICKVLNIALVKHVDTLILGAWGCGVFQNDPETIAKLFAEQFNGKYKSAFAKVIFAVLDNSASKSIIEPFQKYLLV